MQLVAGHVAHRARRHRSGPAVSKSNSPSCSWPTRVRRSPRALRRLAWACSSPRRAARALISRCDVARAAASSACLLLDLGLQVRGARAGDADAGAEPQHEAGSEQNACGDTRTALRPSARRSDEAASAGGRRLFSTILKLMSMSDSKSSKPKPARANRNAGPQAPMEALLADAAFDPLRRALWLDALDQRLRPSLPSFTRRACAGCER